MRAGWAGLALVGSLALHGAAVWGIQRGAPFPVAPISQIVAIDVVDRASGGSKGPPGPGPRSRPGPVRRPARTVSQPKSSVVKIPIPIAGPIPPPASPPNTALETSV